MEGHCAGSEWVHDSSIAVLTVPVVAFVTPHVDLLTSAVNHIGTAGLKS